MQFDNLSIFLAGTIFGIFIAFIFETILKTHPVWRDEFYKEHKVFFGYHFHHSMYGILFMFLGVLLFFRHQTVSSIFFIGIGLGIIIMHTISEKRFVFIEKELD